MANQKSKFTELLYVRVAALSHEWAKKQVTARFPSLSAYIDYLIHQDRIRINHLPKVDRPEGM